MADNRLKAWAKALPETSGNAIVGWIIAYGLGALSVLVPQQALTPGQAVRDATAIARQTGTEAPNGAPLAPFLADLERQGMREGWRVAYSAPDRPAIVYCGAFTPAQGAATDQLETFKRQFPGCLVATRATSQSRDLAIAPGPAARTGQMHYDPETGAHVPAVFCGCGADDVLAYLARNAALFGPTP